MFKDWYVIRVLYTRIPLAYHRYCIPILPWYKYKLRMRQWTIRLIQSLFFSLVSLFLFFFFPSLLQAHIQGLQPRNQLGIRVWSDRNMIRHPSVGGWCWLQHVRTLMPASRTFDLRGSLGFWKILLFWCLWCFLWIFLMFGWVYFELFVKKPQKAPFFAKS